jgi:dTDP-4-dehydrorhamnose reductase
MILVTGANGQVGQELQFLANQYPEYKFLFADRTVLDITDESSIRNLFETYNFDFCINCAAYTAVDKAEEAQEAAQIVNVNAVENLAKACRLHQTQLIHISSDYVYHSESINRPYQETDVTNPQGVYAKTKLEGDLIALKTSKEVIVLRTSWVYSSYGNNFVKTMLRLSDKLNRLNIIFDQIGTPTYARDLAKAILEIINKIDKKEVTDYSGIYHYSNEGVTSWYDFAKAIFRLKDKTMTVLPIETKDYPTAAKRPHFSLMNKGKIKATFDLEIPHWENSLEECLELL